MISEEHRQKLQEEFPETKYAEHVVGYAIARKIAGLNKSWQDNIEDRRKEMAAQKKMLIALAGNLKLKINPDASDVTEYPSSASEKQPST